MAALSDEALVANIKSGSGEDFVTLYDRYGKKIFSFIYFKVGVKEDAEDLCSETFLKAYQKITTFDEKKEFAFKTRLYTIANNSIIDFWRTKKDDEGSEILEEVGQEHDIVQQIQDRDKLAAVKDYLATLDVDKRDIFTMRIRNELSYEEISHIVNKTVTACKVAFHRTLQDVVSRFSAMVFGLVSLFSL